MSSFEKEYRNSRLYIPNCSCIFDVNIYKNDKDLDYICFVEGSSDLMFYNNILNTVISEKKLRYVRSLSSKETDYGKEIGKEGVIKNYYSIYKYQNFKDILSKCIFIVDYDYEGLISKFYEQDEINQMVFTKTPYYAFENFFLTDENIEKIFKYFRLGNDELIKFKKILNQFVEESSNYTRLKSSITIASKKCKYQCPLPSCKITVPKGKFEGETMTSNHIFHFNFNNSNYPFYNKEFMELQNNAMIESIKHSPKIMNYYNNETKKFINNKDFIRGHDIYKLLEQYLLQNFNINISQKIYDKKSRYNEIVKIIDVNMNFVNGLGETIN